MELRIETRCEKRCVALYNEVRRIIIIIIIILDDFIKRFYVLYVICVFYLLY